MVRQRSAKEFRSSEASTLKGNEHVSCDQQANQKSQALLPSDRCPSQSLTYQQNGPNREQVIEYQGSNCIVS
jgi:hypothetical protein